MGDRAIVFSLMKIKESKVPVKAILALVAGFFTAKTNISLPLF